MSCFDLTAYRANQLDRLTSEPLDLLIVGGGIVGAGVARDAALRGLRIGLVEQYDMASGTSSRSSRLLHGGMRYLAQGRLGLVYEASHEKRILHRIAAHLADPLAFVFPTYRGSQWPLWQLRVGVKLYDFLCGGRNLGPSSAMKRQEVLQYLPGPNPEGLTGAVRYYDGLTNDARLVLDTLRAAAAHDAVPLNYVRLEEASPAADGWHCQVHDLLADRTHQIVARSVVHAAGPWAETLPQSSIRLRLTKGVHLVIDRQRLPVPDAVVMTEGSRILFAIPWGERVILGTTDTDYDGPPEEVRTEQADVDYVLSIVNQSFPAAQLQPADLISVWAGLRPLIADSRGRPSDISRAHVIRMSQPGWIDVAGGKLTTYRRIAEQTVDRVAGYLDRRLPPCRTAELPLLPHDQTDKISGITPPEVRRELVEHFCTREWAVHLDDVLVRRTSWQHYQTNRDELTSQVAGWMAEFLGWDEARRAEEVARCRRA
jgi:glycerol-3-phosphate dehydrogenase